MTLTEWRQAHGRTLLEVATALGIRGKNASRTLQRYETGERRCPVETAQDIEQLTQGLVTSADMDLCRRQFLLSAPLTPDAARDSGGGPPRPATSAAGPHPIGAPPELPRLAGVGARESAAAPVIFPTPSEAAE